MPWSAKAKELLRQQYAPIAAAGRAVLPMAVELLSGMANRGAEFASLLARYQAKQACLVSYEKAYRGYCWAVHSLADLQLAPFHLLATEGRCHASRDHFWHMEQIAKVCQADPIGILLPTPCQGVDLLDDDSMKNAITWWIESTKQGAEGMVVKPLDFIANARKGLAQPAIKCRGREYLRIIYGPEYTLPENLDRLRKRGLSAKRSLAMREFALGIEALERFVRKEPLRRVHECVFAVLALESEPVDPRL